MGHPIILGRYIMLGLFILIGTVLLLVYNWEYVVCSLFNLKDFIKFTSLDIYNYFKYKKYNNYTNFGVITMFCANGTQVFGSGKTLSMVKEVISIYKRYNGLTVWDKDSNEFVVQHIHVISNVKFNSIPYIPFTSVNQFIDIDKFNFGNMDIVLYVLDESGAIFNSREFRSNLSSQMLTRLLQSRKNKCCLFTTSQRFNFTDKILRQICCIVYECSKKWRFVTLRAYNPLDIEFAYNPEIIKPKSRHTFFCSDDDYNSYDSYQIIEDLNKNYTPISDKELLETYSLNGGVDALKPSHLTKSYKRGWKHEKQR